MAEHEEQVAVIQFCNWSKIPVAACPNGFKMSWINTMIKGTLAPLMKTMFKGLVIRLMGKVKVKIIREVQGMKAEGLSPGFPDINIPVPNKHYKGLYIELKVKGGKLSPEQKEWLKILSNNGYRAVCCYGAAEAIKEIQNYIREKIRC